MPMYGLGGKRAEVRMPQFLGSFTGKSSVRGMTGWKPTQGSSAETKLRQTLMNGDLSTAQTGGGRRVSAGLDRIEVSGLDKYVS